MSKISQKMYSALARAGISPDVARRIAETVDFLGESSAESNERDNYDIILAAKALSSLVKRHRDITPIMPKEDKDPVSSDMTRVNAPSISVASPKVTTNEKQTADKKRKEASLIKSVKKTSPGMQKFLAYFMPCVWYLLIGLLGIGCICATVLSIAAIVVATVGGIILFFAGLLYGVSQFSVFKGAAFYEIGLALIIGGLSVLVSVLLFNFITRTLPFCLKKGTTGLVKLNRDFAELRQSLKAGAEA